VGHLVLVLTEEAVEAGADDLGSRALRERDHWCADGQGPDHHQAEGLRPPDRVKQRHRVPKKIEVVQTSELT